MIQESGHVRCPNCGEALSVTHDPDNPYFQCGHCTRFFEVSDGRRAAQSDQAHKTYRRTPIAAAPQLRDQPRRRRLWVRLFALAAVLGLLWFGYAEKWTEFRTEFRSEQYHRQRTESRVMDSRRGFASKLSPTQMSFQLKM